MSELDPWELPPEDKKPVVTPAFVPPVEPEPEPEPEEIFGAARDLVEREEPIVTARRREPDRRGADVQRKITYLPDTHRLLPQSPDAERGVLSSFLLLPGEVGGMCADKQITPEHFFTPTHTDIFKVLMDLWDRNAKIDFITLTQVLRDRSILDQCGGAAFITDLFTFLPTAANAAYYMEILEEKYTLREIIKRCTEYAARGYDCQDEVPTLLNDCEEGVLAIRDRGDRKKVRGPKEGVIAAISRIEELYNSRGEITGLSTGFAEIDKMTDGLHAAEMIVIAARPSMGKTALAMNMAEFMAIDLKIPVAVFSLEMSYEQLMQRCLCSLARVNLRRIRDGYLAERDFPALQNAASKIADSKLFIDDSSSLTIQELKAKARRLKKTEGIKAIFIDYLQLLRATSKQAVDNREREVAEISGGLKAMAKELEIPIVVLAQLKRDADNRERPRLSDLRESGSIEQDADLVGFLTRDEYYAENEEERRELEGRATLHIAKQRNGDTGPVALTFLKEFTRFETRAREYDAQEDSHQATMFPT
jgi:replicative DNA helicase